ncbi:MAG: hypothetical protein DHS20C15_23090 [Planctomycetota bacterium]|nr:MAG: hypothetical protein DHS20C15_23090 [Planctomycetota bacterium]
MSAPGDDTSQHATGDALSADVTQELADLYARVDAEVAGHAPRCEMSGRCCDFPRNEHRLYATGLETRYAQERAGLVVPEADSGLCPWHVDGLCQLRDGRPLGCRLYFCDPDWADTMPRVYERAHAEILALHQRHDIAYSYGSFVHTVREGVDAAQRGGLGPAAGPNGGQA